MKKNSGRKRTTASSLESRFDEGEDVLDYFDASKAVRGDIPPQSVDLDLPSWMVAALDYEADKRGVTRQSLVRSAVVEWLEVQRARRRTF